MIDIDSIVIPEELFEKMVKHAKNTAPYESVSIIAGTIKDKQALAEKVFTPENIDKSTVSFTVDPLILLEIYTKIDEIDLEVVGIFHTHPAPPFPSGTDKKFMEVNPSVWLISSTSEPTKPKGYLLRENGKLKNVEIIFTDNTTLK
ncbi:MAG: Mov34/MPN/PAD-1 family protein [Candidatus Heimdallarchaeota archaeon]